MHGRSRRDVVVDGGFPDAVACRADIGSGGDLCPMVFARRDDAACISYTFGMGSADTSTCDDVDGGKCLLGLLGLFHKTSWLFLRAHPWVDGSGGFDVTPAVHNAENRVGASQVQAYHIRLNRFLCIHVCMVYGDKYKFEMSFMCSGSKVIKNRSAYKVLHTKFVAFTFF